MAISKTISKTISKKPHSNNKSSLKLNTLEKAFEQHFTALMRFILQQEKSLNHTVSTLKAKLKKALSQKKSIPAAKKNRTPTIEKQLMKAQRDIDNFELHLALATDELSLITKKLDALLAVQQHTQKNTNTIQNRVQNKVAKPKAKKQPTTKTSTKTTISTTKISAQAKKNI